MLMCQAAPEPALQLMWQNTAMHVNVLAQGVGAARLRVAYGLSVPE